MIQMHGGAISPLQTRLSPRSGLSTFSFVVGSVLWLLVLGSLWFVVRQNVDERAAASDEPTASEIPDDAGQTVQKTVVISFPGRELPDFEFPECMGGTISRESMRGKRWLASFVFTRCVETCPIITRSVSELQTRVAKTNPDFQFVTFSVDSSFDSAEVLQKYAATFRADHDRWKFLTGDENAIHDLVRRGFAQFVKANLGEMRKPGFEVAHSNRAVLVNEDCIPVATFLMTDPEHVVKLRRIIEGKDEFPQPDPALTATPTEGENPSITLNFVPVDDAAAPSESTSSATEPDGSNDGVPSTNGDKAVDTPGVGTPAAAPAVSQSESKPESASARNERIALELPSWVARLPAINATLNSICTVLLVTGFIAIRNGKRTMHRNLMVSAFLVSVAFLACYLTYHQALFHFTGTRGRAFMGSNPARIVYFGILLPHVILAVFVPLLAIRVFVHASRRRWAEHRRLAKITLPIWLFVSITGVVIYWMLYHWPWQPEAASMVLVG